MLIIVSINGGTNMYASYKLSPISSISGYCKFYYYLVQSMGTMFRWMLTAACLDRYALSSRNARLRRFASVYIARRVSAAIAIIWIICPIPLLILFDLRAGSCIIVYGYGAALYNSILSIIVNCGIPVPIMIISSLSIRQSLANQRERRQINIGQQQTTNDTRNGHRKRDQQALIMLFVQITAYIILVTPWMIYGIYDAISLSISNKSADRLSVERFTQFLTSMLITLFPNSSFYLYTLTSSIFRKELLIMLRSFFHCNCFFMIHRVHPIANNIFQLRTNTIR